MTQVYPTGGPGKRVVIHMGLPKTGSSALQAFLSMNAGMLEHLGVSYPWPEADVTVASGVCTGNLLHVMQRRAAADGVEGSLQAVADRYLCPAIEAAIAGAAQPTVLLSGEFISQAMTTDILAWLHDLSSRHRVTILCLVRDPYELAVSLWKQGIKARGDTVPLSGWIDRFCTQEPLAPARLLPLLDSGLDVRVRNYDCIRKELLGAFLSEIGLNPAAFDRQAAPHRNLSLSYGQATAIVMAHQITGSSRFSAALLDRFRTTPDTHPDPYLPDVDAALLAALGPVIDRLNRILPPEERLRDTPRPAGGQDDQSMPVDVVAQLLQAVRDVLATEARAAVVQVPAHPHLPADFDPLEYLMRNPDVAAAGMDPVYHYLNHGRFEGRVYRAGPA